MLVVTALAYQRTTLDEKAQVRPTVILAATPQEAVAKVRDWCGEELEVHHNLEQPAIDAFNKATDTVSLIDWFDKHYCYYVLEFDTHDV